jgi:hypothetical protein
VTISLTEDQPHTDEKVHPGGPLIAGTPSARAVSQRGVEAKARRRQIANSVTDLTLDDASETVLRTVLRGVADQTIPCRHATDAAALIRVLHDIIRLERGQATSRSEHLDISGELSEILPHLRLSASRPAVEVETTTLEVEATAGAAGGDAVDQAEPDT